MRGCEHIDERPLGSSTLPLTCCVTEGKSLTLSEPQSPPTLVMGIQQECECGRRDPCERPVGDPISAHWALLGVVWHLLVAGFCPGTQRRGTWGSPSAWMLLAGVTRASCHPLSCPRPTDCAILLPRTHQSSAEDGRQVSPGMFGFSRAIVVPGGRGCGHARSSDRGTRKGPGLCPS